MHALLLCLALGQAAPEAPTATAAEAPPPSPAAEPAAEPASGPAAFPGSVPGKEAPLRAVDGPALRPIELVRLPDGGFSATLDGEPVSGADFYRAVLRPDLAARAQKARNDRLALWISAGLAPLAGLGAGWVHASSQHRPLPLCVAEPPLVDCTEHDRVAAQNRSTMRSSLLVGGSAGLVTGAALALLGHAVRQVEPTAAEAEALVRAYQARAAPAPEPAPVREGPAGGATLELEAGPRAARVTLRFTF